MPIQVTKWVTKDNKEFGSKEAADIHEMKLIVMNIIEDAIDDMGNIDWDEIFDNATTLRDALAGIK